MRPPTPHRQRHANESLTRHCVLFLATAGQEGQIERNNERIKQLQASILESEELLRDR